MLTNTINENIKITNKKMSKIDIKKPFGVKLNKNILSRSMDLVLFNSFDHKKKRNEEKVDF